jgi:acetoin utilization deacetylase AcuC-like enzyme
MNVRLAVCYDSRQSTAEDVGNFSPSAAKPAALVAHLRQPGPVTWPIDWLGVEPATLDEISLAHDRKWAREVLRGRADNGFGNRSPQLAKTLPWTVGSMIAACRAARVDRPALSPTCGFHHAGWRNATGFCTFNGLVIAARVALAEGKQKVAILDADAHYGNGTDELIARLDLDARIEHWTIGSSCNADVLSYGQTAAEAFALNSHHGPRYLKLIERIPAWLEDTAPDLLIYQAGVDPHVEDPYGGILTTHELAHRDRVVFEAARALAIPVAWNLAGGYQRDAAGTITPVLELHRNTVRAACRLPGELMDPYVQRRLTRSDAARRSGPARRAARSHPGSARS